MRFAFPTVAGFVGGGLVGWAQEVVLIRRRRARRWDQYRRGVDELHAQAEALRRRVPSSSAGSARLRGD